MSALQMPAGQLSPRHVEAPNNQQDPGEIMTSFRKNVEGSLLPVKTRQEIIQSFAVIQNDAALMQHVSNILEATRNWEAPDWHPLLRALHLEEEPVLRPPLDSEYVPLPAAVPDPIPQVAVAVAVAAAQPAERPYIMLTRPLSELGAHIWNHQLPSWQLVARVIKTLFLAVFGWRWHLCDQVLMPFHDQNGNHRIYLNLHGRGGNGAPRNWINDMHPHMLEKAWKRTTILASVAPPRLEAPLMMLALPLRLSVPTSW